MSSPGALTIVGFGETRIHAEAATFEVRTSKVANPRLDDQLIVDGQSFVIQGEPEGAILTGSCGRSSHLQPFSATKSAPRVEDIEIGDPHVAPAAQAATAGSFHTALRSVSSCDEPTRNRLPEIVSTRVPFRTSYGNSRSNLG